MRKLRTILLATDFRPASQDAAQAAVQLASVFASQFTLFHVIEPLGAWPALIQQHRQFATKRLDEFARALTKERLDVEATAIKVGHPADAIVRKANEIGADLILMGAGEKSLFEHFLLGPVASSVVQHATQPVLAIRPGDPAVKFHNILCPVDQSSVSARGLLNAIRLTHAFRGHLVVLSVVPWSHWLAMAVQTKTLADAMDEHDRRWRDDFEQFLKTCSFGDVSWESEVRSGAPHEEIIAAAQKHQADLIVMGSTGRTGLARVLMGSVTRRVIQQLPCSILTVKHDDIVEELLKEDVQTINMLFAEGRALQDAKSYDAALVKFGEVLARNPFHEGALEGRAEAHDKLGQSEDAQRYRRRLHVLNESEYELGVAD